MIEPPSLGYRTMAIMSCPQDHSNEERIQFAYLSYIAANY